MLEDRRSKEKVIEMQVYTDGSLKRIGQSMTFGGWSFIVSRDTDEVYSAAGSTYNTTNQRMELQAIAAALEYVSTIRRPSERIVIYSDSAYAVNCYLNDWYIGWLNNGWMNSKNEPVANQDLWAKIIPYFDNFWYDFRKVKGHQGNYWNERVDMLAQEAADGLKKTWRGEKNE